MKDGIEKGRVCIALMLLLGFGGFQVFAQSPDIFRVEFMLMPKNKAEAELSRYKLVANVPLKVRETDNIIVGAEYNYLVYKLGDTGFFDSSGLENLHVVDLNLAYVYKHNENWRFIGVVTPRLSSTLTNPLEMEIFRSMLRLALLRIDNKLKSQCVWFWALRIIQLLPYAFPCP